MQCAKPRQNWNFKLRKMTDEKDSMFAAMITIITSTMNCNVALQLTARSIFSQQAPLQWIIADGGSVDGTVEFLESLSDSRVLWFSEPDSGIYDAWNKACRHIKGDWVVFLGAGDTFVSSSILASVNHQVAGVSSHVDFVYGNVSQIHNGKVLFRYGEVDLTGWQPGRPALPAHQGILHRSKLLTVANPFDQTYRIAGDTKFLASKLTKRNTVYLPQDITYMDPDGISSDRANAPLIMRELLRVERDLGYVLPRRNRIFFIASCYVRLLIHRCGVPSTWSFFESLRRLRFAK